jgi:hypothetical protein
MKDTLHVGDTVMWRGGFGNHAPLPAKVTHIEKTETRNQKSGSSVDTLPWGEVPCSVVNLDNGHWAYGDQISPKE